MNFFKVKNQGGWGWYEMILSFEKIWENNQLLYERLSFSLTCFFKKISALKYQVLRYYFLRIHKSNFN